MNQFSSKRAADAFQSSEHKKSIKDQTYPRYHLRAPSGWVNDPCGLFYFNSSFHVFMQSNPWSSSWGDMSWSHVVSYPHYKDECRWFYPLDNKEFKTTAIIPSLDEKAADRNGIFTGCVKIMPFVENDEVNYYPTAFYSAVWGSGESTQETICIARALDANVLDESGKLLDPYLTNWTKYSEDGNQDSPKIVLYQPEDLNLVSFRDPFIFNLPGDKNYYMLMAAGRVDENNNPKGVVLCFKNNGNDVTQNWVRVNQHDKFFFEGNVCTKDSISRGGNFECVSMFRLTDHVGAMNNTPYILIFAQDGSANDDYGRSLYYLFGDVVKTSDSMYFEPLDYFKNENGEPRYRVLDLSPDFIYYAANLMPIDSEKRNILMAWLNIHAASGQQANWAGALALPRFLFVYKNDSLEWQLGQEPALINNLKSELIFSQDIKFIQREEFLIKGVSGRQYCIKALFSSEKIVNKKFGLKVVANKKSDMNISINNGYLNVDNRYACKLDIDSDTNKLELEVYLDGSSLEIFLSKNIDNGSMVGFATYSAQLKTISKSESEQAYVYAQEQTQADIKVYNMQSCWVSAP
jgi:sucrose-6-phosphate hydrolase SacC (GH32 family)